MWKKMIAGLLACVCLSSIFTACSGKTSESTPSKTTLTIGVTSFADTLEPTEQYFGWVVMRYGIGQALTRFDENGVLQPWLAQSWSLSEDKCTWTFEIRPDVRFSNGNELTAQAVKSSLERTFEKNARARASYFQYTEMTAQGNTLTITTESPTATVPGSLADPLFLIVDTTADTQSFAMQGPVCTGPYQVESFQPTEVCVVSKNPYYWNGEVPYATVTLRCIDDQATRAMALETGEIDIAYNLKIENVMEFQENPDFGVQSLASLRSCHAFMNQHGVLADKQLRQAILCGLDRQTYCNVLLQGGAVPGKAPVPPSLDYGFDQLTDPNSYDPTRARQLLEQGGYRDRNGDGYVERPDGTPLNLQFVVYDSRAELGIYAQAAQASLKEIGIQLTIETVSYETLLDMQEAGQYDLLIWNVLAANTGDPEAYLRESWMTYSEQNPNNNYAGYSNTKVDTMLKTLSSTFDQTARRDLMIQIQQEILNDAATIFFGYETTYLISSTKVAGLKLYPMDYYWLTEDVRPA